MSDQVEHFIYEAPAQLKRFRAGLPAMVEISTVPRGLILRETLPAGLDRATAVARIVALALEQRLENDGHGLCIEADDTGGGLDIQPLAFTERAGVMAGHGFVLPLPDGRCGHAIYLGGDRQGYLLLDVTSLISDRPASPAAVRDAPKLYRQPVLVWHTGFATLLVATDDLDRVNAILATGCPNA